MASKPITFKFYMLDRDTGEAAEVEKVPPEAIAKMSDRLSRNLSDYYTQHMGEYVQLQI